MSLNGPAFDLIKDLRQKNKNQISMKLYALLKKRFSPKERKTAHKDKFWTRRQLKNENVTDLGYAIKKLSYLAFTEMDTNSCESLLVKHYTRGLSSYDTKRHVRLNQPLTLDEAISLAMQSVEFEISHYNRKPSYTEQINAVQSNPN